jgi:hypothetical protein
MASSVLRPRQRDALTQWLRSGVTPRLGARATHVGREAHIGAPAADLARMALNWVPATAMAHQFVVTHAALMKNPALRTPPGGGVVAVDG